MFDKILIANRGEIACRVIATSRRMGIAAVAVYSDADAESRHVAMADEAYAIGPAPARLSYLRGDRILEVARACGAQAIHPGYGFLSENADFAQACADAGIVFIGPPPAAIRAMGSKAAAKSLMAQSNVPLVPGYHGADQNFDVLQAAASTIGYPVLLKASAGGGGKGMRVVEAEADLAEAIDRAKGEARASFGYDSLLVEKYLTRPRHIEVQVFADTHGNYVSLFERDCSIQRRHQKVLEESPAPGISAAQRQALGDTAVAAARAVDYVGAGTVEFIYEDQKFYFMEMNTRLQVEHPVTEFVTGQDLVEWQFRVAAGERLPLSQDALSLRGHAIEARICAEDPERDFMPATGLVTHLRQPTATDYVRVDTGIREGDRITPNYDSMIAKLIVWGEDRGIALRRMEQALRDYELAGLRTNLDLLRQIVSDPDFASGDFDTGFIGRHPEMLAATPPPEPEMWAAAVMTVLQQSGETAPDDPWSPWAVPDGWRMNGVTGETVYVRYGETSLSVRAVAIGKGRWELDLPSGKIIASLRQVPGDNDAVLLSLEHTRIRLRILRRDQKIIVIAGGHNHDFTVIDPLAPPDRETASDAKLVAPTPARVVRVFVQAGMAVTKGQNLLTLEAMKVETRFVAPRDAIVEAVHVQDDELIAEGAMLVTFKAEAA